MTGNLGHWLSLWGPLKPTLLEEKLFPCSLKMELLPEGVAQARNK